MPSANDERWELKYFMLHRETDRVDGHDYYLFNLVSIAHHEKRDLHSIKSNRNVSTTCYKDVPKWYVLPGGHIAPGVYNCPPFLTPKNQFSVAFSMSRLGLEFKIWLIINTSSIHPFAKTHGHSEFEWDINHFSSSVEVRHLSSCSTNHAAVVWRI